MRMTLTRRSTWRPPMCGRPWPQRLCSSTRNSSSRRRSSRGARVRPSGTRLMHPLSLCQGWITAACSCVATPVGFGPHL